MNPGDFVNQLIKTTHNRTRFEMLDTVNIKEDVIPISGNVSKHKFSHERKKMLLNEFNSNGDLVHQYKVLVSTFWETIENLAAVHIPKNGKYIVVETTSESHGKTWGGFQLFHHKGNLISSSGNTGSDIYQGNRYFFDEKGDWVIEFDNNYFFRILGWNSYGHDQKLDGFGTKSSAMAFSPSGTYFAVGSDEGGVKISDASETLGLSSGGSRLLYDFSAHYNEKITAIAFCNNETILKTVTDNGIKYWQLNLNYFTKPGNSDEKLLGPGD